MLVDAGQTLPPPSAASVHVSAAGSSKPSPNAATSPEGTAPPVAQDGTVVVTARSNEQFRLRPLNPPDSGSSFFARPLHIQIAPGISLGAATNGVGLGLHVEFGPGRKSGDRADQPKPAPPPTREPNTD